MEEEGACFLCLAPCSTLCPDCRLVNYCGPDHLALHRHEDACLPYRAGRLPDKGRVLFATRDLKPLDLVLVDPGTVVGPNYRGRPVCLGCLKPVDGAERKADRRCPVCDYPVCGAPCAKEARHLAECGLLARARPAAPTGRLPSYAQLTPLRMLQRHARGGEECERTEQLMDHLQEAAENPEEWSWYEEQVSGVLRTTLGLADRFSAQDIRHAVGLLNVNAVSPTPRPSLALRSVSSSPGSPARPAQRWGRAATRYSPSCRTTASATRGTSSTPPPSTCT
jgi:hypothetical protein